MTNFEVHFSVSPWVLLLLIPLFALTFIIFFSAKKRFRRSRNRIISLILHCLVTTLCVLIISGIYFTYEYPNVENELVILVDASYTSTNYRERTEDFVHEVLKENGGRSSVAIVKFGYDQKVAVPMGKHNPERAYERFLSAESPDVSATDIASALNFVWDPVNDISGNGDAIIHFPETAKILLISDGLETDRSALNTVRRITMDGVQVDTTFFPSVATDDIWITDVTYDERSYAIGETVAFSVNVRSSYEGKANLRFLDKAGKEEYTETREDFLISVGTQSIPFSHAFDSPGHHELSFELESLGDSMPLNNVTHLSFDIDEYISLLVIEKYEGESNMLVQSLYDSIGIENVRVEVQNVAGDLPTDIETLSRFDEVILNNIANEDMSGEFVTLLDTFVKVYGGGLFTVGGFERDERGEIVYETVNDISLPKPHAYSQKDMEGTAFQEMLPVEIEDYTPPVALAIVIDRSSSMDMDVGAGSALDIAVSGAIYALNALSPRDQVGVLTLEDNYQIGLSMTPMTQKQRIISTIRRVASGGGGGTSYAPAIDMAGATLCTLQNAQRKHILLLSDGQPSDGFNDYNTKMQRYYQTYGITITVISIGREIDDNLNALAANAGGSAYTMSGGDISTITELLKLDLGISENISGAVKESFNPQIASHTAVVSGVNQAGLDELEMKGFFTSVAKSFGDVEVSLLAKYVPLYAQWNYGLGKVGSFMCDLEGHFSGDFLESEAGLTVLHNAVSNIVSKVLVRGSDAFSAVLIEDNYRTQVSIFGFDAHVETNKKLVAFIRAPGGESWEAVDLDNREISMSGNRFTFENRTPGIYTVQIVKVPKSFSLDGVESIADIPPSSVSGSLIAYRAFSYSKEYDSGLDPYETGRELLINLSTREVDEGAPKTDKLVYDASSLLSFFADVHETKNPRILFCVLALLLLILDIIIRKFKFKWLHEIILTRRRRKAQFQSRGTV